MKKVTTSWAECGAVIIGIACFVDGLAVVFTPLHEVPGIVMLSIAFLCFAFAGSSFYFYNYFHTNTSGKTPENTGKSKSSILKSNNPLEKPLLKTHEQGSSNLHAAQNPANFKIASSPK